MIAEQRSHRPGADNAYFQSGIAHCGAILWVASFDLARHGFARFSANRCGYAYRVKDRPFAAAPIGERTIALSGELDLAVRAQLQEQFQDAVAGVNSVAVDLTQVTYMDS